MALFSLIEPFSEFYIFVPIRLGWMDKSHNTLDLLFYILTYIMYIGLGKVLWS